MTNYNLGLVSVSFRQYSPQEILSAMKKTKLSCIEWGSDIHAPYKDTQRLYELAVLQKEYDIFCCSYGTYFRLGGDDTAELEDYANAAKILGTNLLRIWCGDKGAQLYSKDEKKLLFEEAKKAARIAKALGVTLCMECHNNTYTETIDGALELMSTVNSQSFRMYWQPNQFKSTDVNIEYAKLISPYVKNIHVFNWERENKYPLCRALDVWKGYLSCFNTPKNLLLEFIPDGKIESLEDEASALFSIAESM